QRVGAQVQQRLAPGAFGMPPLPNQTVKIDIFKEATEAKFAEYFDRGQEGGAFVYDHENSPADGAYYVLTKLLEDPYFRPAPNETVIFTIIDPFASHNGLEQAGVSDYIYEYSMKR